jgi:KDO2-lipid IV(A) lauroyltransferase
MWIRCLRWFAHLPLPLIHGVGWLLGWLIFLLSVRYRQRVRENLQQAQLMTQRQCVIGEAGKMLAELLPAWLRSPTAVRDLVMED